MGRLEHTTIYRAGVTAPSLNFETETCSFYVDTNSFNIRFNLDSKGGGTTRVLVEIGMADLPAILEAIANKTPENVGVFLDCASVASKRNVEQLKEIEKSAG